MPGTYSIITRADGSILTSAVYMQDHQVHLTYNTPGGVDDYSTSVAQMQSAVDPGEVGSESLPTDLAGELQRLRKIITEITGKTYWYESPASNLGLVTLIMKRKTADESVTASTTLQDDDHLTFAIAANEEWVGEFVLDVGSSIGTTGVKIAATFPSGATFLYSARFIGDVIGKALASSSSSPGFSIDISAASMAGVSNLEVSGHLWVLNGATPGNVTFQFAQSTSGGLAVTMRKGSALTVRRVT